MLRLKAKLNQWKDGAEPIPPAILPTYEGQTWIDIDRLCYRFDRPATHPNPFFHQEVRWGVAADLSRLLEANHPTERIVHGARCHICYDPANLNFRVASRLLLRQRRSSPGGHSNRPLPDMGYRKAAGLRPGNSLPRQSRPRPDYQAGYVPENRVH